MTNKVVGLFCFDDIKEWKNMKTRTECHTKIWF